MLTEILSNDIPSYHILSHFIQRCMTSLLSLSLSPLEIKCRILRLLKFYPILSNFIPSYPGIYDFIPGPIVKTLNVLQNVSNHLYSHFKVPKFQKLQPTTHLRVYYWYSSHKHTSYS